MFVSPDIVHCFDRSFAWDENTEPDLAGYNIYYKDSNSGAPYDGTGADEGNSPIQIPLISLIDPANPEYTIHGLRDTGTFYFVITAYDIYGNESSFSNELTYQPSSPPGNTAPVVTISEPAIGSSFNLYDSILFTGSVSDREDGDISDHLLWRSNIDGVIGSGATFSTSTLSEGTHTITASVTENGGLPGSDIITVTVVSSITSIVIDNGNSGTSYTGSWYASGGSSPYGGGSLYARPNATYTWGFDFQLPGYYEVFMWWSWTDTRASNIKVDINTRTGPVTVVPPVDQTQGEGQWNSLGTYLFNSDGSVTITAASGILPNGRTVSTCADAVQFIYQSGLKNTISENNGRCSGDFNSNGVVDGFDLAVFSQAYVNVDFSADLNSNGIVDADDLAILATELGRTDCQ